MVEQGTFEQLARWIDELARKWERYMSNDPKVPIPPERERAALARRLNDLSRGEPISAADRFRLDQLLHRFTTYNNLWMRQLRERETAAATGGVPGLNAGRPAPVPSGEDDLARLHTRYVELLQATGHSGTVSAERFRQALEGERVRLRQQGADVEGFEVVQDGGAVRVRARLRRRRQG